MTVKVRPNKQIVWSVLGGSNGGQSLSAHLALMGFPVRLYDIFEETIEAIRTRELNPIAPSADRTAIAQ